MGFILIYQFFIFFGMSSSSSCVRTINCRMLYFPKWIVCNLLIVAGRRQIGNKEDGKGFLNCWHGIIVAVCVLYN